MARIAHEGWEVIIPGPIVMETYSLLLRRVRLEAARSWLEGVGTRAAVIAPNVDDYEAAVAQVGRYPDHRLSLFDAQLSVLAQRFGLPVWTYDADFDVLGIPVWR